MLGIRALEPAPTQSTSSRSHEVWRWQHAVVLLGCVSVILAAILASVFWFFLRPVAPSEIITPQVAQQAAKNLTPAKALEMWEYFKQGLDQRTSPRYEATVRIFNLAEGFCAVLGLAGAAMIVLGVTASRHSSLT
jgi:hypothetical protein